MAKSILSLNEHNLSKIICLAIHNYNLLIIIFNKREFHGYIYVCTYMQTYTFTQ